MPFENQNKKGEKFFSKGSYVSSLGKPGVTVTLWESLVSCNGQSGSLDGQEPQARTPVLARTQATASSNASLRNAMNNAFHCHKLLGLTDRCSFWGESISEFSRIFSLLFFLRVSLFLVFFFSHLSVLLALVCSVLGRGLLTNRFSWLNKIPQRNALVVSFS